MDAKLHALMDEKIPTPYYWLLGKRRKQVVRQREKLSLEEIKKLDEKMYYDRIGKHINWDDPKTYTEKNAGGEDPPQVS